MPIRITPDTLMRFEDNYGGATTTGVPFNVASGNNQPVWMDVYVPKETLSGDYTGTITVKKSTYIILTLTCHY